MLSRTTKFARIHWVDEIKQQNTILPSRAEMDAALDILRKREADLQWGDLAAFSQTPDDRNDGLMIFDGEQLLDLDPHPDEYGTLPPEFKVLQLHPVSGVVIQPTYWHDYYRETEESKTEMLEAGPSQTEKAKTDEEKTEVVKTTTFVPHARFISHNNKVWFDHRPYARTLINNLGYGKGPCGNYSAIYTWFTHPADGVKTYIVVNSMEDSVDLALEIEEAIRFTKLFVAMLASSQLNYFDCGAEDFPATERKLFWYPEEQ